MEPPVAAAAALVVAAAAVEVTHEQSAITPLMVAATSG
jgi:hypothetical protein